MTRIARSLVPADSVGLLWLNLGVGVGVNIFDLDFELLVWITRLQLVVVCR